MIFGFIILRRLYFILYFEGSILILFFDFMIYFVALSFPFICFNVFCIVLADHGVISEVFISIKIPIPHSIFIIQI